MMYLRIMLACSLRLAWPALSSEAAQHGELRVRMRAHIYMVQPGRIRRRMAIPTSFAAARVPTRTPLAMLKCGMKLSQTTAILGRGRQRGRR